MKYTFRQYDTSFSRFRSFITIPAGKINLYLRSEPALHHVGSLRTIIDWVAVNQIYKIMDLPFSEKCDLLEHVRRHWIKFFIPCSNKVDLIGMSRE